MQDAVHLNNGSLTSKTDVRQCERAPLSWCSHSNIAASLISSPVLLTLQTEPVWLFVAGIDFDECISLRSASYKVSFGFMILRDHLPACTLFAH